MSKALYKQWSRRLERIEKEQLRDLLINRHIFKQHSRMHGTARWHAPRSGAI